MIEKNSVVVVAFEGSHRSGKGRQLEELKKTLSGAGILTMTVKGDGRRPLDDEYPIQLDKELWKRKDETLARSYSSVNELGQAAYRLAREMVVARDRVLPRMMESVQTLLFCWLIVRLLVGEQ